jgi:hypothetical protein
MAVVLFLAMSVSVGAEPGAFENLGVPVTKGGLMGVLVGPGPSEGSERIYFNFRQDGGKLFLVAVNPATGASEQFQSPVGTGAWGFMVGPDNKIYLGTHEGPDPGDSGQVLVFDPKQPEKQIQVIGRPSESETYLWMYTIGLDGRIYGCTYPGAKLVAYDPKTGELADLGIMDESQKYTRSICTGPDGRIYVGVGYGRANVVVYDPKTGEHRAILPDIYREDPAQTVASVYKGSDEKVYITGTKMVEKDGKKAAESVALVVNGDSIEETASPASAVSRTTLQDGRVVRGATLDGTYELVTPDGTVEKKTFTYAGAGSGIFMVSTGPLGRIYGGTAMPNQIFWYDPATGDLGNPGNPTDVDGEIYSMVTTGDWLYVCAYPGSYLSKWNPSKPWNYGHDAEHNPRGFSRLGVGHLRPRAMILGPDDKIYIGSYPEYGRHGGALGIWDPVGDTLLSNHHNLIPNQSIVSLVFDPVTGLVFGGSATAGGGGTDPIEKEARFFAFDSKEGRCVFEDTPFPGEQSIGSMAMVGRKVFGIAGKDNLFVYDPDAKKYLYKGSLGIGAVVECALGLWKDGKLYGLTGTTVFRLDPDTYEVTVLATYPGWIRCGFAMDDHGIYFGDRATLMRYNWPME